MYQDFTARRPMEVETYLGAPVELARSAGIRIPRTETLYTLLRHVNATNKDRPLPQSPAVAAPAMVQPPPRVTSIQPPPRQPMPSMNGGPRPRGPPGSMGPPGRRGPPPVNGFRGHPNGYPTHGQVQRRPSLEENNLDEFSHVVLYDDMPDGEVTVVNGEGGGAAAASLRERELMLREKELHLRQQEMSMRRGGRRPSHNPHQDFDDDDDDDYVDPMQFRGPPHPAVDADNLDMMSVTSRRTKRAPSQGQLRRDMYSGANGMRQGSFGRPHMGRNRTSAHLMSDMPMLGENILNNPMMGFSSNRYGAVDRKEMHDESRANSLTAARLQEMGGTGGPYPAPPSRRTSRSPGNPFGGMGRGMGRPSPPNDGYGQPGPHRNDRPSPPGAMPAPLPRYPPGQGNMIHPHQVEQQVWVSKPYPPKLPAKSLTGSASASANSGDSGSANIESEPSAHSSTSSFMPRAITHVH
jgi:Ketopantoate reductase PanE/ApbA C terminal